jgi:uncharacterized membrane protein
MELTDNIFWVINDIVWAIIIIAGTGYLLYHSLWKKKGHCPGCSGCACPSHGSAKIDRIDIIKRRTKG